MFIKHFSLGLLFREMLTLVSDSAQTSGAPCLHMDKDSVPGPFHVHWRAGRDWLGVALGTPAVCIHWQKNSHHGGFCYVH